MAILAFFVRMALQAKKSSETDFIGYLRGLVTVTFDRLRGENRAGVIEASLKSSRLS
jgi:hypothetical protein